MHSNFLNLNFSVFSFNRLTKSLCSFVLFLFLFFLSESLTAQCSGFCGTQSSAGCWCDAVCFDIGDCCPDVCLQCGSNFPTQCSCSSYCGGFNPNGCYCDNQCQLIGDCCFDQATTCAGPCPNGILQTTLTPPCGTLATRQVGSGERIDMNVTNGSVYYFDLINCPFPMQITARRSSDNSVAFTRSCNNGITWDADFTGQVRLNINRDACQNWQGGGTANSATLRYRNNLPANPPAITGGGTHCVSTTLARNNPPANITYFWQGTSCGTSTANSSASLTVTASGTYYLRARSTSGCWSANCSSTSVIIQTNSTAATGITGTTDICSGQSTTLTVSGGSLGTGANWFWYSGSCGGAQVGTGNSISVSPSSSTTYYVRAEGTCNTTTCVQTSVLVSPQPTVSLAGGTEICPYESTTLTATANGGTGTCSYQWQISSDGTTGWANTGTNSLTLNTGTLTSTQYYRVVYSCTGSGCNNATSNVEEILVVDNQPPVFISCPANVNIDNASGTCVNTAIWAEPVVTDNCSIVSVVSTHASGDVFPVGITTVIYTATDVGGNTALCSFTVTVNDIEAPEITGIPSNIIQDNDSGQCNAVVSWTEPTASDNCAVASFTSTHSPGDVFPLGTTSVTYTAQDSAGNITTVNFSITIEDNEAPVISGMPADVTQDSDLGQCNAIINWTEPNAADNCAVASFTSTHSPGDVFSLGTTTVTYTAEDSAGNITTANFSITIEDNEAPVISGMPADIIQGSDSSECSAIISWTEPTATDNCGLLSFTSDFNPGDTFPVGTSAVTYTAEDSAGNITISSFNITIEDNEFPIISGMPADTILDTEQALCEATVLWTEPTASDNCGIATFTSNFNSGDVFPVGVTTVIYTAIDSAGNETVAIFNITVEDNEPPIIFGALPDIVQDTDSGSCNAIVTWTEPVAIDNCGITSFTSNYSPGDVFPLGTTQVIYIAEDSAGNSKSVSFTITVKDNEPPDITGMPGDIVQDNDSGECSSVASWVEPSATDNCGVESFSSNYSPGDVFPVGTTVVTYTAVDSSGNITTSSFEITIEDAENPVIWDTPADIVQDSDSSVCGASVSWVEPIATDNCGVASFTSNYAPGDIFPVGTTVVTYVAIDSAGNSDSASFHITILDIEAPIVWNLPADIIQGTDSANCNAVVSWVEPTATDNCEVISFTSDYSPGDTFALGTTIVTYIAIDSVGNTTSESFSITVDDTEAPIITGIPDNITQGTDSLSCSAIVSWIDPIVSDNCAVTSFTSSRNPGDVFPVGNTTVVYTAMDAAGNITAVSFTVTVEDTEAPVIFGMPDDIELGTSPSVCFGIVSWTPPLATDNCGVIIFNASHTPGNIFPIGTTEVSYTAIDAAGNITVETFNITVVDDSPPVIVATPSNIVKGADPGKCGAVVNWNSPTTYDNCGVVSFVGSHTTGTEFPVGNTTVTYTSMDASGNITIDSFTITVDNNLTPVPDMVALADIVDLCIVDSLSPPTATDNCVGEIIGTYDADLPITESTTITWTYDDGVGNISTQTQEVIITGIGATIHQEGGRLTTLYSGEDVTYLWVDCNQKFELIENATSQSFSPPENGYYAVVVTDGVCVDTSVCIQVTTVGIIDNAFSPDLKVYPNPTDENLTIDFGLVYKEVQIEVMDMVGKLVKRRTVINEQIVQLKLEGTSGIYFIRLQSEDAHSIIKVIKK